MTTLEKVVLAQYPEIFIYAAKIDREMIVTPTTAVIEVYNTNILYPKPSEGKKFTRKQSYANVRVRVVSYDVYANKVLAEDGKWYDYKENAEETKFEEEGIEPIIM